MLKSYLSVAFRNLRRNKAFSVINILGLSIGISSALVIYLIAHYDFSFDRFEPGGDRIYRVVAKTIGNGDINYNRGVAAPLGEAIRAGLVFAKSAQFVAIYNIAPVLPGHCLIVPIRHIRGMFDLNVIEQEELVKFSLHVAKAIVRGFQSSGFNWIIQEGMSAGQTVEHLHVHIIPRHDGDLPHPGDWYPKLDRAGKESSIDSDKRPRLSKLELKRVTERLRAVMG